MKSVEDVLLSIPLEVGEAHEKKKPKCSRKKEAADVFEDHFALQNNSTPSPKIEKEK